MPTVSRGIYRWLFQRSATLEDFADRLNHFWTFGLLLILACIISWKQGAYRPMICLCPPHSTGSFVEYTNNLCWNSHSIIYPRDYEKAIKELGNERNSFPGETFIDRGLPVVYTSNHEDDDIRSKMSTTVTLYQWLPVLLCFQALMFKLPNILMFILHSFSGVSFDKLSGLTGGHSKLNMNERELMGRQTGRYVYNWCKQFEYCLPWRLLTLLWVVVKLLYCVNIITQLCLMDGFLKTTDKHINDSSTSYGEVIKDNIFGNNATMWKQSSVFPRQVLCDLQILQVQNIQRYAVQCHLPMNEFNEDVYMFLWVWLLIVALITCLSFITWLPLTLVPIFRKRYITKALSLRDDVDIDAISKLELDQFADFIGEDGVMTLKLIGANSSEHLVRDVVCTTWGMWKGNRRGPYGMLVNRDTVTEVHVPLQPLAFENDMAANTSTQKI